MKTNNGLQVYWDKIVISDSTLFIAATDRGICFIGPGCETIDALQHAVTRQYPHAKIVKDTAKLQPYTEALHAYFTCEKWAFNLPVDTKGTGFQETVWNALQKIPYGETRTYTEIAEKLGKPSAVRAVASAIGANPVLIVVPCHRVIGKNGKLSGYRGGIPMKKKLLAIESK